MHKLSIKVFLSFPGFWFALIVFYGSGLLFSLLINFGIDPEYVDTPSARTSAMHCIHLLSSKYVSIYQQQNRRHRFRFISSLLKCWLGRLVRSPNSRRQLHPTPTTYPTRHHQYCSTASLTPRASGKVSSHLPRNRKSASASPWTDGSALNTATLPPRPFTWVAKPAAGWTYTTPSTVSKSSEHTRA